MRASIIAFGISALAAMAYAAPTEEKDLYVRSGTAGVTCGNGQVISCCNTSKSTSDSGNGALLGLNGLLDGVLGGSCTPLGVGVLGAGIPINKACGNNVAACCTGDQTGNLLNLQCTTLNLL
ncbi:hypothetical protein RBB50_006241 [Rhinocladiella similis]